MTRWRLWLSITAAIVGAIILAACFRTYSPSAKWPVLTRRQLVEKGRQVTRHFGLNTDGWKFYEVATLSNSLAHYQSEHELKTSPLSVRITFRGNEGKQAAEVGFDSGGELTYWRPPTGFQAPVKFDSNEAAATQAFQFFAAGSAASYRPPVRTMGDESHEQDYEWKLTPRVRSELRTSIKVATKDGAIERVERKVYLASDDEDSEDSYGENYWDILAGVFGLICTVGLIVILAVFVLWLVRRVINYQFPVRIAATALLLMGAALRGFAWQRMRSINLNQGLPILGVLFLAAAILCIVTVARSISEEARPKWFSLEQLCRLAPLSKSTGESIAAGLLFSPLLVAIPFLIVASGLLPHSWVLPHNPELLYSRSPLLDSLKFPSGLCLLGFFGFGLPALERSIRFPWMRWLVIVPLGTVFFADETRVVSGPLAAPLAAGFLTLALFWFVWASFDVLATLTLHVAAGLLTATLMFAQHGHSGWTLVAALAALTVSAIWFYARGQVIAEGDERATIPALTGFRAEREKLRAEFSVARRAQQDMLPQTPPNISGYTIAASCTPSLEVGGDLYDFLKLQDGRVGIVVADVSGKGVPAALYMTLTKGLLASVTKDNSELKTALAEVNRHLHGVTRKKVFVTMVLGFLDAEKRQLECVRAGHNPVVWRQTTRNLTTLVSPAGIGLGITAGKIFGTQLKVAKMALHEGDAVVFYSDGITEAMNSSLEQFGEERLMHSVEKADYLDAATARDSILTDVRDFLGGVHPQDDMTIVVLRVGEKK